MKKREEKYDRKSHERDNKHPLSTETGRSVRKVINLGTVDTKADFLSFSDIDMSRFTNKNKSGLELLKGDSVEDIETRISRKYDRDQYPWLSDFTLKVKEASIFLHNEILDFVKFIESTPEDLKIRKQVVNRVKSVVRECYPEASVMVFGSCASGLNLPNSDIDMLIYLPEIKETAMINKLTQGLLRAGICKSIDPLKHAKVPIIKLQDRESGVNVDISFNRTNGIYCVKLVKHLLKKYPELRPLLLVLKCFLKSRQLNEPYHGGVGSFLLTMITTSYLQRRYKSGDGATEKIDLGRHLIDFFEFYGTKFNYEEVGLSIREEGFYFPKRTRGWEGYDERSRYRLSVENPQDPEVDIGNSAWNIRKVQRAF